MGEGNIFSCVSVHTRGVPPSANGEGTPIRSWGGGVLSSILPSFLTGGTPILSWLGSTTHQDWMGYLCHLPPPLRTGWGTSLVRTGWASTCYVAGSMPLAFTQEDFLVTNHIQKGGGWYRVPYSHPSWQGVPILPERGYPHPSQWGREYPHPVLMGVPHPVPMGGYPHPRSGSPPRQQEGGGGTPNWNSIACTWQSAGGMPLAFTQEDFLVADELWPYLAYFAAKNYNKGILNEPGWHSFCCFRGICSTKRQVLQKIQPFVKPMAHAYLRLYNSALEIREFFGLRDFYR